MKKFFGGLMLALAILGLNATAPTKADAATLYYQVQSTGNPLAVFNALLGVDDVTRGVLSISGTLNTLAVSLVPVTDPDQGFVWNFNNKMFAGGAPFDTLGIVVQYLGGRANLFDNIISFSPGNYIPGEVVGWNVTAMPDVSAVPVGSSGWMIISAILAMVMLAVHRRRSTRPTDRNGHGHALAA